MVYSPPSNQHTPFPQNGAKPHVVTDEIDAGSIKLQPPKIRPISRSSTPKRRGTSAENWKRPAIRSVTTEQNAVVDSEFRSATTASTVELLTISAIPILAPTVENLTHEIEVVRHAATTELHANACDAVRQAIDESNHSSPITQWETPYNKPAIETPENIQYTRLALQYLQQGRIEDAERLYKQALIVAERTFPAGNPAISRAVEDLATFFYGHEKYKQAEPFVSRLLKQRVETLACDDWLLIRTVDQLADVYEKCGEPIAAQALYKLLLARQEEAVGKNSPVCAFTLSRLAESYLRQEHYSAAESLLHTILSIQEALHGRCSIEISTTLQELANIYQKLSRYDRAAEMLERLLHILETIHGDNGLSVASCLLKLADLLTEVEMVSEAEPLYRRAQEIYSLSYGERTAAHSMFKKKLERVTDTMINISKLSKDKPVEQEECSRFPAVRLSLDDMLPSKLGTGQPSRCLGHAISVDSIADNVVPFSAKSAADYVSLESIESRYENPIEGFETTEFSVTSALIVTDPGSAGFLPASNIGPPMFDLTSDAEIVNDAFEFSTTFEPSTGYEETADMAPPAQSDSTMELSRPSFFFDQTAEMPITFGANDDTLRLRAVLQGSTLELNRPDLTDTLEMERPSFDLSPAVDPRRTTYDLVSATELTRPAFDFTPSTELSASALDFAKTIDMVVPSFDFTPSFEIDSPNFDSIGKSFDVIKSKFESNGELDSILDPFFAKELASIYEQTAVPKAAAGAEIDWAETTDQQDTILDLEPAKTLALPRSLESKQTSIQQQGTTARNTQVLGVEKTAKPRRLASKTVSLPRLKSTSAPQLAPPVPGLVTLTATEIHCAELEVQQSPMQLRDTVREKPVLLPEQFPSSRNMSATQTTFAVNHRGSKTRN